MMKIATFCTSGHWHKSQDADVAELRTLINDHRRRRLHAALDKVMDRLKQRRAQGTASVAGGTNERTETVRNLRRDARPGDGVGHAWRCRYGASLGQLALPAQRALRSEPTLPRLHAARTTKHFGVGRQAFPCRIRKSGGDRTMSNEKYQPYSPTPKDKDGNNM